MNRKIKVNYTIVVNVDVDETIEITNESLNKLGLDEDATDDDIVDALNDNDNQEKWDILAGYIYAQPDCDNTPDYLDMEASQEPFHIELA